MPVVVLKVRRNGAFVEHQILKHLKEFEFVFYDSLPRKVTIEIERKKVGGTLELPGAVGPERDMKGEMRVEGDQQDRIQIQSCPP